MTLKVRDVEITSMPPEIPRSMPVFKVKTASLDERKKAIDIISKKCNLGNFSHNVEFKESLHLMNKMGEVQYYRPSGSLWVRNIVAEKSFKDERRPWKTKKIIDKEDKDNFKLVLPKATEKELIKKTQALFRDSKLLSKQAYLKDVSLEQISQLDEKGNEINRYPGEAIVRYLYKFDGIKVDGAGAKSYAYFNPVENKQELVGIFHSWRDIVNSRSVRTVKFDDAILKTILKDRELNFYHKKKYKIKITKSDLVYYSFPPFNFQEFVFPALKVKGFVKAGYSQKEKYSGFDFARYFHVASAEGYAKSEIFADYLTARL